jgi:hypothetical protein
VGPHRVVEAEYPGKRILASPQPGEQILPDLVLDAPELMAACAEFTEGLGCWGGR